ncbi:flavin reductase (NADPH)-like [Branchiostoma lanceolatum]|uniref:flavin reductase (NADPH)-like n=1 Tax=Branchiostoma lanceolatum TaxID=7740 RepID=UPI00345248A5
MLLAVLGASGQTGVHLVQQALDKKNRVLALVRDTDKMNGLVQDSNLEVVEVDVMSEDSIAAELEGRAVDVVISCLGRTDRKSREPSTFHSDSLREVVGAMRRAKVKRLVCVSCWWTTIWPQDGRPWWYRWFLQGGWTSTHADLAEMEEFITMACTDIIYTVVKPPVFLTDGPLDARELKATQLEQVPFTGRPSLSRANLARFLLFILSTSKWNSRKVAIL